MVISYVESDTTVYMTEKGEVLPNNDLQISIEQLYCTLNEHLVNINEIELYQ